MQNKLEFTTGLNHLVITKQDSAINFKLNTDKKIEKYDSTYTIEQLQQKSQLFSFYNTLEKTFKLFASVVQSKRIEITMLDEKVKLNMTFFDGIENNEFVILVDQIKLSEKEKYDYRLNMLERKVDDLQKKIEEKDNEIQTLKKFVYDNINYNNSKIIVEIVKQINGIKGFIDNFKNKKYVEWGIIQIDDQQYYEGQIVDNKKTGFGTTYNVDGTFTRGTHLNNKFEGFGIRYFSTKRRVERKNVGEKNPIVFNSGCFINDHLYGLGTYLKNDGEMISVHSYYDKNYSINYLESKGKSQLIKTDKVEIMPEEILNL